MIDFSLHLEAMAWLRYGRRWPYVASEVGYFKADVLGSDGEKLIEVEIKKSKADFANDFKNKGHKHMLYRDPGPLPRAWIPNQFYFLVPAKLQVDALELLDANKSSAGLLVLERPLVSEYWNPRMRHIEVVRKAKTIHRAPVIPEVLERFVQRMASDLVTTRLRLENLAREGKVAPELLSELRDAFLCLQKTPDWETTDENDPQHLPPQPRHGPGEDDADGRRSPAGGRGDGQEASEVCPPPNCS